MSNRYYSFKSIKKAQKKLVGPRFLEQVNYCKTSSNYSYSLIMVKSKINFSHEQIFIHKL